jgi:hypothetical protein
MTQQIQDSGQFQHRRQEWIDRVTALVDQVAQWSQAEGWTVERSQHTIQEKLLGTYDAPALKVHLPGGDIFLTPIALHITGGNGRVELEALPTLSRVRLIGENNTWRIITDSNVPLRQLWNRQTFTQLAHDLLS